MTSELTPLQLSNLVMVVHNLPAAESPSRRVGDTWSDLPSPPPIQPPQYLFSHTKARAAERAAAVHYYDPLAIGYTADCEEASCGAQYGEGQRCMCCMCEAKVEEARTRRAASIRARQEAIERRLRAKAQWKRNRDHNAAEHNAEAAARIQAKLLSAATRREELLAERLQTLERREHERDAKAAQIRELRQSALTSFLRSAAKPLIILEDAGLVAAPNVALSAAQVEAILSSDPRAPCTQCGSQSPAKALCPKSRKPHKRILATAAEELLELAADARLAIGGDIRNGAAHDDRRKLMQPRFLLLAYHTAADEEEAESLRAAAANVTFLLESVRQYAKEYAHYCDEEGRNGADGLEDADAAGGGESTERAPFDVVSLRASLTRFSRAFSSFSTQLEARVHQHRPCTSSGSSRDPSPAPCACAVREGSPASSTPERCESHTAVDDVTLMEHQYLQLFAAQQWRLKDIAKKELLLATGAMHPALRLRERALCLSERRTELTEAIQRQLDTMMCCIRRVGGDTAVQSLTSQAEELSLRTRMGVSPSSESDVSPARARRAEQSCALSPAEGASPASNHVETQSSYLV